MELIPVHPLNAEDEIVPSDAGNVKVTDATPPLERIAFMNALEPRVVRELPNVTLVMLGTLPAVPVNALLPKVTSELGNTRGPDSLLQL